MAASQVQHDESLTEVCTCVQYVYASVRGVSMEIGCMKTILIFVFRFGSFFFFFLAWFPSENGKGGAAVWS